MNKKEMVKLAVMGIVGGMLVSSQASAHEQADDPVESETPVRLASRCSSCKTVAEKEGKHHHNGHHHMTEEELRNSLSKEGKEMYSKLDQDGKNLALKLANQDCKGNNSCKGQGGCKSPSQVGKNDCKGQGQCKGFINDPNLAVKVAQQRMAEKRNQATK